MLSYAGVILSECSVELARDIEACYPVDDRPEFLQRQYPPSAIPGLTFASPAPLPKVKVGRLTWPAGASRWAVGHFLCTTADLAKIRPAVYGNSSSGTFTAQPLVMNDGKSPPLTTNLWMLPPVPLWRLFDRQGTEQAGLWLLTLVDDRYYWWDKGGLVGISAGSTTYASLYETLGGFLGVTIAADPVNAAYGNPGTAFQSSYVPACQLLDAAAYNCGQRIVRQLDGTVEALNASTAFSRENTNLTTAQQQFSGGVLVLGTGPGDDMASLLPSQFAMVFPSNDTVVSATPYVSTAATSSLTLTSIGSPTLFFGGTRSWQNGALADFHASDPPANQAAMDALLKQFATDWCVWQAGGNEVRYDGILTFDGVGKLSPLSDVIEWDHVVSEPSRPWVAPQIFTRLRRAPWNDVTDQLMTSGGPKGPGPCNDGGSGNTVDVVTGFNASSCAATVQGLSGYIVFCGTHIPVNFALASP